MKNLPYIDFNSNPTRLIVDEKPFFIRGGEIHNSSSSSVEYMEKRVWPVLRELGLNTVVLPVFWELIEPVQGEFDFSLTDSIINMARREGKKLVFLWFGLWKNSRSTYVPSWVKKDIDTYFRVRNFDGKPLNIISPLCEKAVEADSEAFKMLMKHIKEVDEENQTVIMIQVENEIGILGAPCDFSKAGKDAFADKIPNELEKAYGKSGTWTQVFGDEAQESFMAWYYAKAIEAIASTGKKEYALPMYVNAWLEQFPEYPGNYPSGGPVFKMRKIWNIAAPTIEFLSPDIYVDNFRDVCDEYSAEGNPLFIPELRNTTDMAPFLFYIIGKHSALGFSPFAVDDLFGTNIEHDKDMMAVLNINLAALGAGEKAAAALKTSYKIIAEMEEEIFKAQEEKRIHGFLQQNDNGAIIHLSGCDLMITYNGAGNFFMPAPPKKDGEPVGGGFVIECGEDIYITGVSFTATFVPKKGENYIVEVINKEEGSFSDGKWTRCRVLNGDEGYFHRFKDLPETQKFQIHTIN